MMPRQGAMLDVDTILGLPRSTKKASSLRKPRQPASPPYINKERALAIAKKFKITTIGKVSVRAGSTNAVDDLPRVSLESEKVLNRKILLEREKGLETAMNTKDSAVGKCILGKNDYESRRLGVESDKLHDDSERKKFQLLRRKSVFVHQRGLTLTQGGIVFDPSSPTNGLLESQTKRDSTKPLPSIQTTQTDDMPYVYRALPLPSREKSPSYMRPLSCDRTRSTDSQVAEVERFLASPIMRQFTKVPDEDSTLLTLKSVGEFNALKFNKDIHQTEIRTSLIATKREKRKSQLAEIAESASSDGSDSDEVFMDSAGANSTSGADNFPVTKSLRKSRSMDENSEQSNKSTKRTHFNSNSDFSRRFSQTLHKSSRSDEETKNDDDATQYTTRRHSSNYLRRSTRKSSTISSQSFQTKHKKKKRRKRVSFIQRPGQSQFNVAAPAEDPRFTELTSFLVPDSAKAFNLYRAMGRLSVLDK